MKITDVPPEIVSHIGVFLRDDTHALRSAFLAHRCFGTLQHKDIWGVLTVFDVPTSAETLRVMRMRQPQLRELTVTVDLTHWTSSTLNALNMLLYDMSFCHEIAITFTERVNVHRVFKGIDTSKYRVTFANEVSLPMHLHMYQFQYVNISIPAFRLDVYRDVLPKCQHVKVYNSFMFNTVEQIELDHTIDPTKTKVYIECEDLDANIHVYNPTCIDGIFIKDFTTSRTLDVVMDFYLLHRIHVRELVFGTLHIEQDIFPNSSYVLQFLKYVTAQTYVFEMTVYPWMMSLLQELIKERNLHYSQIYLIAIHHDAFVAARVYQLVLSPDINICPMHTKYANIHKLKCNQYLNLSSYFVPAEPITHEDVERILRASDVQWLLSQFRTSHYRYVWEAARIMLKNAQ